MNRRSLFYALMVAPVLAVLAKLRRRDDSLDDAWPPKGLFGVIDNSDPASVVGNYGSIDRSVSGEDAWALKSTAHATKGKILFGATGDDHG